MHACVCVHTHTEPAQLLETIFFCSFAVMLSEKVPQKLNYSEILKSANHSSQNSELKVVISYEFIMCKSLPVFAAAIFGGTLLCVKSSNTIAFYDWEGLELIRRIEISPRTVRN